MTTFERTIHTLSFRLQGLDCPDCAAKLEKAVRALPGVNTAELSFAASRLVVTTEREDGLVRAIQELSEEMGQQALLEGAPEQVVASGPLAWLRQNRRLASTLLGGVLFILALALRLAGAGETLTRVLYAAAMVVSGVYVARAGWAALRTTRSPDMNVLMSIAAVGAMFVGEYAEGAAAMLLFSVGELLESYSMDRARNAIRALMQLAPATATVWREGVERDVPVAELRVGERLLVRPGERVPMDGRILEGQSALNQAPITGESLPVAKGVGAEVYAGSINGTGALMVEVTRLAADNTLARIMRLVEESQAQRAPAQRFVDAFARVYTPIVMALAVAVAVLPPLLGWGAFSTWLYRALVLLVISCPCALVISTPVTIVSALARAARAGVLIKGGRYLEQLAKLRVIAFDKTGTLTEGKPHVINAGCELHPDGAQSCAMCEDLIGKAAAVEGRSEHALAQAVIEYAKNAGVGGRYAAAEQVKAVTGLGIEGTVAGHTILVGSHAFCHSRHGEQDSLCGMVVEEESQGHTVVVVEDTCCKQRCYLAVADTLRPGVPEYLRQLKEAGITHTVMLTGDNAFIADSVAKQAGIDEVRAGLLPEGKVQAIVGLQERYGPVAMVGDGVNDAPAMAKASVGVAMGAAGTATALETADMALMGDDLSRLPFALRLGRAAMGVVRANVILALLIKAVFMTLAVTGGATMWMAVLADVGASLLVTLNGLRLLRFPDSERGA
jgi:Cd2+/Zn2+-exporting ATPase